MGLKYLIIPLFLSLFLMGKETAAQTAKFFPTENGLSSSLINQIYQDKTGYIWVATEDGLNQFDGVKFITYRHVQGDSLSLMNNYVRTLFEDASGILWVGCIDGVMQFNRYDQSFRIVPMLNDEGEQLFPHIVSIVQQQNGDIWFSTSSSGLFVFRKGDRACHFAPHHLNDRLSSRFLSNLFIDSHNLFWIGTVNQGLNCYDPSTDSLRVYVSDIHNPKSLSSNAISCISESDDGVLFVGSLNGGLNKYCPELNSFEHIEDVSGKTSLSIKSIMIDRNHQMYVGTDGQGMKLYNANTNKLENHEPVSTPFDFTKAKVHSVLEDKDGNLWAGVFQKGVFLIPRNPNGFKYYGYRSFKNNIIGSNCVMSICKDDDGVVWVGTDNDGLYAINEDENTTSHFFEMHKGASVPATIMCMLSNKDGKLWLGSFLDGLSCFDKNTKQCIIQSSLNKELKGSRVYCLAQNNTNYLWVGTCGDGLYKFDLRTQTIVKHFYQNQEGEEGICNNWVNTLKFDSKGNLWIGTYSGLCYINTNSNLDTAQFVQLNTYNSKMPSNIVYSLQENTQGGMWIGTDAGLVYYNNSTKSIKVYGKENGLSNSVICGIEIDDDGNVWCSSLSGISKFSMATKRFTNYYVSDGLQGSEFTRGAHYKASNGELFFGGTYGVTSFFPKDILPKQEQLHVYLTHFFLFENLVKGKQMSKGKVILDEPIMTAKKLTLHASDNIFSFEFSCFEYGKQEGISYHYCLSNFDVNWVTTPPGVNRVTYTNLSPGKYTFSYQAVDRESKSEIKSIEIIIYPPWYATGWAYTLYVFFFLLLLSGVCYYIVTRLRNKRELERLEHADKINESKLQFFINISHEIRTPMTLIMGPLERLLKKPVDVATQNSYLLMYRNAQRILRLINQLMDIRKIDRGQMFLKSRETDLVGFVKDIMQAFEYSAQTKNIKFHFEHSMPELKVWIDLNNFDKVLFNLFSNAFKFTPEQGEVVVRLEAGNDSKCTGALREYAELSIWDSGVGIPEDEVDRIFERFYQMDQSPLHSSLGTGIGLHLSRSLVELQYGTIAVRNRENESGCCFTIRLPLGNSHFKPDEMVIIEDESPLATFKYSQKDDHFESVNTVKSPKVLSKTKYRILVVEDDLEINNYVKDELSEFYHIHQCSNGKEAWSYIIEHKPDLVISDIMMPEMNGITLCKNIKSNVNTEHIPVILLTAKNSDDAKVEGLEMGADAYLSKPFNLEVLKKTAVNILENRERLKGKFTKQSEGKMDKIEIKSADEVLMSKVLKIINSNIANPNLNVEMLSSGVGMSRVHMHRKLKQLTNQSARDFIRNIRMKQAGELLLSKKLTISDVAYAVGFSTLSHFSSCFKTFYGKSPSDFLHHSEESERK